MKHLSIIQYEFIKIAAAVNNNWWENKKFPHPYTGNVVEFKSLPLETQKMLNAQHKQSEIYDSKFSKVSKAGKNVGKALSSLLNTVSAEDATTLMKVIDDIENKMNDDVDTFSKKMRSQLLDRRQQTSSKDVRLIDNNKDLRKHLEEKKLQLKKLDALIKFYSKVHARRPKIRLWTSKDIDPNNSGNTSIGDALKMHKKPIQQAMTEWSDTISRDIASPEDYMQLLGYGTLTK